jgi:hypothetical protein
MQRLPSAADVVNSRQAEDYSAQLNGTADVPLSKRTVTGIHCLSSTDLVGHRIHPIQSDTATSTFHASQTSNRVRSGMQRRHNSFLPAYLEKYCATDFESRFAKNDEERLASVVLRCGAYRAVSR